MFGHKMGKIYIIPLLWVKHFDDFTVTLSLLCYHNCFGNDYYLLTVYKGCTMKYLTELLMSMCKKQGLSISSY